MSSPLQPTEQLVATNDPIEVDDADAASTYAESGITDTTSFRSSILNYKYENGRRYHSDTPEKLYWGPNDERQQEAEDLSHQMFLLVLGGLSEAPISEPERVLDVGCGTGAWAIDFADEHPASEVTGIDISPIQSEYVPPNCRFELEDVNKRPWTFDENYFDYVHIRTMTGTVSDWTEFYKTAINHVKPGGWIEQVETSVQARTDDDTIPHGGNVEKWPSLYKEVGEKIGVNFFAAELACSSMKDAGFVNVNERKVKVPVGTWPKDKRLKVWGEWFQYYSLQGLEGFALRAFTDVLGWSYPETQVFLGVMRNELKDPKVHLYADVRIVCGQKPSSKPVQLGPK